MRGDSGAKSKMGIWQEVQFGGDTEASVGPGRCEGPRGRPGRGVQDTEEPTCGAKERDWGRDEQETARGVGMRSIGRQPRIGMVKGWAFQTIRQ